MLNDIQLTEFVESYLALRVLGRRIASRLRINFMDTDYLSVNLQ